MLETLRRLFKPADEAIDEGRRSMLTAVPTTFAGMATGAGMASAASLAGAVRYPVTRASSSALRIFSGMETDLPLSRSTKTCV